MPRSCAALEVRVVSIKDVARAAGVSVGTASNVLNRPDIVSPALRERVERAIDQLGFVRHESARHLRAGSSRTIAMVVLDVANPFFSDVVTAAELAAEEHGAQVVVCNSGGDPSRERRHLEHLVQQRVMGVLLTPVLGGVSDAVDQVEARGSRVVLVDHISGDQRLSSVAVDDVHGGRLAGAHLVGAGHRTIAFVGGPLELRQVADRLAGLREHADVVVVDSGGMSVSAGAQAASRLLDRSADPRGSTDLPGPLAAPTAVFCANDLLALGVLNECQRRGVRVPGDLAIIGYDDIEFAATASVPLSSVQQPRELLGRTAVELLLERVATPDAPCRSVLFTPDLVVRESSRTRPDLSADRRRWRHA